MSRWMLCLVLWGSVATAQVQPAPDPPRLVLDIQGPNARTMGVAFSRDSHRLYAGGFSKVVHVWDVGFNGVNAPPVAAPIRTLRWPVSRANQGAINAVAMSPGEELLVIGGASARGSGDLTFFDTDTNELVLTFPGNVHHKAVIETLAFSPDGAHLLSIDRSAEARLWRRTGKHQWVGLNGGNPIRNALFDAGGSDTAGDRIQGAFISNSQLVLAQPEAGGNWQLALYNTNGQQQNQGVNYVGQGDIGAIAGNPAGTSFAVGDQTGTVSVFDSGSLQQTNQFPHAGQVVTALAFGRNGLLAVGTATQNGPTGVAKGKAQVTLWDVPANQGIQSLAIGSRENIYGLSFSADGRWLATHRDDTQEVLVFQLLDAQGERLPAPFSVPALPLRGRGQEVTRVAVVQVEKELQIGFSHRIGQGGQPPIENIFRPLAGKVDRLPQPATEESLITGESFAAGWSVASQFVAGSGGNQIVQILDPNRNVTGQIDWNGATRGQYLGVFCFVPGPNGQPSAVALGTDTQANIFLFSLNGKELRTYRDHQGEISSMSVTPDGRYLVSGSRDQTIKIWSLQDLGKPGQSGRYSEFGCDFVLAGNAVVVQNVLKAGIAFARNFRDGDQLARLRVPNANGTTRILENPQEILQYLQALPVHRDQVTPFVVRDGKDVPPRTVRFAWEPLLTVFVDTRGEWAIFSPEGYYDASPAEGHRLFGWQINDISLPAKSQRFELAENLQRDFEKPDVIRRVLEVGNVPDALNNLNAQQPNVQPLPIPQDFGQAVVQKVREVPEAKIIEPKQSFQPPVGAESVAAKAEVNLPANTKVEDFKLELSAGGRTLPTQVQAAPADPQTGQTKVTLTAEVPLDQPLVQMEATVREKAAPITQAVQQHARHTVRGNPPPTVPPVPKVSPKLHLLLVGCENFVKVKKLSLDCPKADCRAIRDELAGRPQPLRLYDSSQKPIELYDDEVTLPSIQAGLKQIQSAIVTPQDVVVVMFSGHGAEVDLEPEVDGSEFYFIQTSLPEAVGVSDTGGKEVTGKDAATVAAHGLAWKSVCDEVNALPCHVLWFVDACHSGAGTKHMTREVAIPSNRYVLVSSTAEEQSFENSDIGHGLFTQALLDGLSGQADTDHNGIVDVTELQQHVQVAVPLAIEKLKEEYDARGETFPGEQHPVYVPTVSRPSSSTPTLQLVKVNGK